MPVLAAVQRAFPLGLSWKRRPSADKGKARETVSPSYPLDHVFQDGAIHLEMKSANVSGPFSLHGDDSHSLHIAVKPAADHPNQYLCSDEFLRKSVADDSDFEWEDYPPASVRTASARARLSRVVHWASIVQSQSRWTHEQEKRLRLAQKQLAICQKAWSSEQELWLDHVRLYGAPLLLSS
ncbi:Uncharacterized protein PECH_006874 [Penicillium ucsense]|uniref:Uncharacterized protein n=1 Tax=Penicillium ucsense TaxID=2839758 RepID=A0A8J8W7U4_9EURO|nr:Uncharacterized protein PECM_004556 [Penicillium ucsense]KAF7738921.1 Uncharacterized protein PECH_006874 [Penicillium ucsense]